MLVNPDFATFQQAVSDFKPSLIYLAGHTSFEHDKVRGTIGPLQFKGESRCAALALDTPQKTPDHRGFPGLQMARNPSMW